MTRIVTLLVIYLVSQFVDAQTVSTSKNSMAAVTINVKVPNISGSDGEVLFSLYDSNDNFIKRNPIARKKVSISEGTATVTFTNVTPGEYAIMCLHDKNMNGKMDFNEMGMPLEDYGCSNNIYRMGPPLFEDAKFIVENKSLDLTIKF